MKRLILIICLSLLSVYSALATDYYASTTGSGSTCSIGSPCSLDTALAKTAINGNTLYLRGGTYYGRYVSSLVGSTVRSFPNEWAIIDGYRTTTTSGAINSSVTSVTVGDTGLMVNGTILAIEDEDVYVTSVAGNVVNIIRGWNGTTAASHASGTTVWAKGNTFTVNGSASTYRDFEVKDSNPNRSFATLGDASGRKGGEGFWVTGPSSTFINVIVHDCQDGFFLVETATNVTVYGAIVYNNGHVDPNRGNGHGLYVQNNTGTKTISNVISFNNFATGMKGYGEGGYANNITFTTNTSFNNGSPANFTGNPAGYNAFHRFVGITIGTAVNPPQNGTITGNYLYQPSTAVTEEGNIKAGYISSGGTGLTITNNYIMGGSDALSVIGFDDAVVTGNHFYSGNTLATINNSGVGTASYTWNNNEYHDLGVLGAGSVPYSFAINTLTNRFGGGILTYDDVGNGTGKGWKQWSGFDTTSTYDQVAPSTNVTAVLPNAYEAGRATIVVYNWQLSDPVTVSLASAGLTVGQKFEIRNVQDYFGAKVLSNQTYTAAMSVNLATNSLTVATPIGLGYTPASTCPQFCVYEVVPLPSITCKYFFSSFPAGCPYPID
jgi:hypothetical protein